MQTHFVSMVLPSGPIDITPIPLETLLDVTKTADPSIDSVVTHIHGKLLLCITNVVQDPPVVQFLIETESIQNISPAIISRCGVVFMQPSDIGWQSITFSWLNTVFPVTTGLLLNNIIDEFSGIKAGVNAIVF
jgi:hypothetical protein